MDSFPECNLDDRPSSTQAGLREWALPYAADSAVTRYLADFLRERPRVDAILFNGGSLHPEALRLRLQQQIAKWQPDAEPIVLHNSEPHLAVARGAARFGSLVHRRAERIEAGAARAIYLEVHRQGIKDDQKSRWFAFSREMHPPKKNSKSRSRDSNCASITLFAFKPFILPDTMPIDRVACSMERR